MKSAVPPDSLTDPVQAAKAMRSKGRRLVLTLLANLLLLLVMVGGPYARGHVRTRALWRRFARVASCVLGGRPASDPGLGLPHGAKEHYAALVMQSPRGWPARCDAALSALAPAPVTFLLPSVKTAELDVAAASELLRAELSTLVDREPGARVPERPILALEKVRAALARHAQASGVFHVPEGDAIEFDVERAETGATRVPLYASADAEVWWHGTNEALSALALDRRGLSYVHVSDGGMIERRAHRPARLRSLIAGPRVGERWQTGATLVWAMDAKACDAREDGCAHKAFGVAPLDLPFEGLPEPRWLASHPAGRVDHSVWREGTRVRVLASTPHGGVQVRQFELPPTAQVSPDAPPQPASLTWPAVDADRGLLLPDGQGALAFASGDNASEHWFQAPAAVARSQGTLSGVDPWALSCDNGRAGALGTGQRARLWTLEEGGALRLSPAFAAPLGTVVHDSDTFRDRAQVQCWAGEPLLLLRANDDRLAVVRCSKDGCKKHLLADHVRFFDTAIVADTLVAAYAGSGARAQVLTRIWQLPGARGETPVAPAPCWVGGGGLCGLPRLLHAEQRLLVAAREGTDLRVMQSSDGGRHWTPMRGLRKAAAP